MTQFYPLSNFSQIFSLRQFFFTCYLFFGFVQAWGQCTNTTAYGSLAAPAVGISSIVATTNLYEYNTITGVVAGATYVSTHPYTAYRPYITVRSGTYNGTVVAHGYSPLMWTAVASTNHYVHYNTNSSCGTASGTATNLSTRITRITTTTACSGTFTDPGGASNYADNKTNVWVFYPSNAGEKVRITFTAFATENNYDGLMIYNGNSNLSSLISSGLGVGSNAATCPAGSWRGTGSPGTITSTAADGSLTFVFMSDGGTNNTGWSATISCFNPCTTPTSFSVTGGGAYCAGGSTLSVGLSGSQTSVSYQLKKDGVNSGSPISGTGSAITFTGLTATGNYTIVATGSGSYCTTPVTMSGSANITSANPVITTHPASLTACDGAICSWCQTSFTVATSASSPTYQWYYGTSSTGPWTATDGVTALSGHQSNTLLLTGPPLAYNGFYVKCDVTSAGCATASNSALLTVSNAEPVNGTMTVNGSAPTNYLSPLNVCVSQTINVVRSGNNSFGGTTTYYSDNSDGTTWSVAPYWEIIDWGNITAANQVSGVTGVNNSSNFNFKINNTGQYLLHSNVWHGTSGCPTTAGGVNLYMNVVALPTSVISGTATICPSASTNLTFTLTGTPPWSLTYTDGTTPVNISGINSSPHIVSITPSSTKTYTVTALSDASCTAAAGGMTGSAVVTVRSGISASASATNQTTCNNGTGSIALTRSGGSGGYTYSWSGPNGFTSSTQNPASLFSGTYNVTVTDASCPNITATASANITAPWSSDAGNDVTTCNGIATLSGGYTGTLPPGTVTLFTETFESYSNALLPATGSDWRQLSITTATWNWQIKNTCTPPEGTKCLNLNDGYGVDCDYAWDDEGNKIAWYGSLINATGISALKLNFKWKAYGENNFDYGTVVWSTNGTTWTDVSSTRYQLQSGWQTVSNLDLSAANGQQFYIGFRWVSDDNTGTAPGFSIDDISITGTQTVTPTYAWSGPGTFTPNNTSLTPTVSSQGTYTLSVTALGCTSTDQTLVTIVSSVTNPSVTNNSGCLNQNIILSASGAGAGESYKWYSAATGGILLQTGGNTYTATGLSSTTNYWVSKYNTSTLCESNRVQVTATVFQLPIVNLITGNTNVCLLGTTQLSNSTSGGVWSITSGTAATINSSGLVTAGVTAGSVTVAYTVTDGNNCTNAATTVVNVLPLSLSAPVATSATSITSTSFIANWNSVSGAIEYLLDVSTSSDFSTFVPGYEALNVGNVTTFNVIGVSTVTNYFYRVRASNPCGNASNYSNTIEIGVTINLPAGTNSYTLCTANFYDSGGVGGDYSANESRIITFYPQTSGSYISAAFSSFNTQTDYDYMYVYNGNSITSPLIGIFTGTTSGTIISSAADGSLTFRFTSDGVTNNAGWAATISCSSTAGSSPAPVVNIPRATSNNIYTCGGTFYDSGGSGGNYTDNEDRTITFYPANAGDRAQITFSSLSFQSGDILYLYDGPNTSATLIGSYTSGSTVPGSPIISGNTTTGTLTARFVSNASTTSSGWVANLGCYTPCGINLFTGNTEVCQGSSNTYSVSGATGATSYTWTLPSGWSGTSNISSINTIAGNTSGNVSVTANGACGGSTVLAYRYVEVKPSPLANAGLDVQLPCSGGIGLTGSSNNETILTEDFGTSHTELNSSSGTWRLKYLANNNRTRWFLSNSGNNFSCATLGSALVMMDDRTPNLSIVYCDYAWDNGTMDEIAYNTTLVDARLYTSVNLAFNYRAGGEYSSGTVYDYWNVVYSLDNGVTWNNISAGNNPGTYTFYRASGVSGLNGTLTNGFFSLTNGTTQTGTANVDLSFLAGQQFLIGYRWVNNGSTGWVNNFLVDNINITGTPDYAWSPTAGVTGANTKSPTVTQTATYNLTVTAGNGCTATDAVTVSPTVIPTIPLVSNSAPSCTGLPIDLTVTGLAPGGKVASLSGTNTISGSGLTSVTNTFTIEFWVKPNKTITLPTESTTGTPGTSGQSYVLFPDNGGGTCGSITQAGVGVSVGTNGIAVFEHAACHMPALLVYAGTISSSTWTHVVVEFNSKQSYLFINGNFTKQGLQSQTASIYPSTGTGNAYGYFSGNIDNIRIWSDTRTVNEILSNMFLETPLSSATLVAHYNFNSSNTNATIGPNNSNNGATFSNADYITYTWSGAVGTIPSPAANTNEIRTTPALTTGTYSYTVSPSTGTCVGSGGATSALIKDNNQPNTEWTGNIDTDWFHPLNWTDCTPGNNSIAVIPRNVVTNRYPIITNTSTIDPGTPKGKAKAKKVDQGSITRGGATSTPTLNINTGTELRVNE